MHCEACMPACLSCSTGPIGIEPQGSIKRRDVEITTSSLQKCADDNMESEKPRQRSPEWQNPLLRTRRQVTKCTNAGRASSKRMPERGSRHFLVLHMLHMPPTQDQTDQQTNLDVCRNMFICRSTTEHSTASWHTRPSHPICRLRHPV